MGTRRRQHGRRPHGRPEERGATSSSPLRPDRIYGIHAVTAWLDASPQRLRTLAFDRQAGDVVRKLVERAKAAGVVVEPADADSVAERAGHKRHQGLVAECAPFPYVELEDLLTTRPRLVVVVDQLQDPHNLGAIVRTAEAAGAGGLVAPKDNCVAVTAVVEASSAGATAWLPIARVTNVARSLAQLKEAGYWIAGLSARAAQDVFAFDPPDHVALLVGGESGIRPLVAKQVDFDLAIPMHGRTESLNASVAAAIGIYALLRDARAG